MKVSAHIQLANGEELLAGSLESLEPRIGSFLIEFRYDSEFLRNPLAYPLSPDLPLDSGPHISSVERTMPAAFSDAQPDMWGRRLLEAHARSDAKEAGRHHRKLSEMEVLLAVPDLTRQGALRIADASGFLSARRESVSTVLDLPNLIEAAQAFEAGDEITEEMERLFAAGTSMGGARPKATVRTASGGLAIAKLPRAEGDFGDAMAWEATALELARLSGMRVENFKLHRTRDNSVLVVERFDRRGSQRIGYLSADSLLLKQRTELVDYAKLADVALPQSSSPRADGEELFRRVAFTLMINNIDDHMKNHGFVRETSGWRLSPAFDVNPHYRHGGTDATPINDQDDPSARDIRNLVASSERFGVLEADGIRIIKQVEASTRNWREIAATFGIEPEGAHAMRGAFDNPNRELALRLPTPDESDRVPVRTPVRRLTGNDRPSG